MNLPEQELKILNWWKENNIFQKSVEKESPRGDFVFYEGPPTANGMPGIHHVLSRAFKDIIPRFKTMQGYRVVRKGGWDTHGLPVELEVEKQLGLKNKKEVEAYGIAAFNKKCRESVWRYKEEWEKFTERMGFWLDLDHAYITYEGSYVNGLWAVIKKFWERGLLIEGHKVVPHCPRCGTVLSSHELALGYEKVEDLSLTVKFKVRPPHPPLTKGGAQGSDGDVYIFSWTTTPWTLPGNVALAVNKDVVYCNVKCQMSNVKTVEYYILAKDRLSILDCSYEVVQELKGSELVGLEYEPLFDVPSLRSPASYKVYAADFVSTQDGTGVVHTAVMYGEDDYQLGSSVGLPKVHTVNEDGTFVVVKSQESKVKSKESDDNFFFKLAGRFVKDPETERMIIEYLAEKGLVFKKEVYEHDYPFCWRCKTPLLYYAKHSWFVAMSKLRNELIEANNQINWVPGYIKEGRFGEWLREVKDWAFSRERYWGTPLPVWRCQTGSFKVQGSKFKVGEGCGKVEVIGSVAELVQKSKLKNRYIFMRHGEAESNVKQVCSSILEQSVNYPLTKKGNLQAKQALESLKGQTIDCVFASDYHRTRQTAEIFANGFGSTVAFDPRLREIHVGEYEGKSVNEATAYFLSVEERFTKAFPHGEHYGDVLTRMSGTVKECEARFEGKTILVVSHGDPLWVLLWALAGSPGKLEDFPYPQFAEPVILDHGVFLTDEHGELDLHRPRVDEVEFPCACGGVMRRVLEVADVWFDSGAMPFAQYPENIQALMNTPPDPSQEGNTPRPDAVGTPLSRGDSPPTEGWPKAGVGSTALKQFPADYIAEAIDQTRGWFYTLLAVSVALGKGTPYKNVICLGHILDAKGKKMSKSLGNIVVPEDMFAKYGADAVRWYLFTMNDPGLPKRFDEKELREVVKKFFLILWNVVSFHELYPPQEGEHTPSPDSVGGHPSQEGISTVPSLGGAQGWVHVLDRWILARLNQLIKHVTERLEAYDVTPAGRAIQEFVTDLSTWYVRRSRERMKAGDEEGRQTLKHVLVELSKLVAPFVPFTAEAMWQRVTHPVPMRQDTPPGEGTSIDSPLERGGSAEQRRGVSVHLTDWPQPREIDTEVLHTMDAVRRIVEVGLAARALAKMPIRQPLQSARIKNVELGIQEEYAEILKDELNVKEVMVEQGKGELSVELDTTLTEELKLEGMKRELVRAVNNLRKEARLTIKDTIVWELQRSPVTEKLLGAYRDELRTATIASDIHLSESIEVDRRASVRMGDEDIAFGF